MSEKPATVLGQDLSGDQPTGSDDKFDGSAFLADNVGDGKKFATVEEAVVELGKSKFHADSFIKTLELEAQGERTEKEKLALQLADSTKIDDLLKAIDKPDGEKGVVTPAATVDMDQVKSLVGEMLTAEKDKSSSEATAKVVKANQDKAFALLSEPVSEGGFGSLDNGKLAIREYCGDDTAKQDIINRMGAATPDAVAAFLKLQLNGNTKIEGIGGTAFNTPENLDRQVGGLTWSQCMKIKKENPRLYKNHKFVASMHEAAASNPNFMNT